MVRKLVIILALVMLAGGLVLLSGTVKAENSLSQVFYYTPTPDASGNIYYVVKQDDTCISISLMNNITEEQLRSLNRLNVDDCRFLQEGQKLLLATASPIEPTTGPTLTPSPIVPTATPEPGFGEICIKLFDDVNGNAIAEASEAQIARGVVSISGKTNTQKYTGDTLGGEDPLCFKDVPEGEYAISLAPPEGYNPTTLMNTNLTLRAGELSIVDFGAQLSSKAHARKPGETQPISPIVAILGVLLLGSGVGLALYTRSMLKPKS